MAFFLMALWVLSGVCLVPDRRMGDPRSPTRAAADGSPGKQGNSGFVKLVQSAHEHQRADPSQNDFFIDTMARARPLVLA
ncbi:MAG: hypothetical protein EPN74_06000 [Rhodanobacter sp.]|nr:MAG: hypothetical protein EPN74_06000 [Rhodanobacter sp.]